ncbi:type II toxin-antitoxin system RelE/ParE family toxin [Hespellia stercorisuis]|uniref:type II toxin-antitoxin system RelE/ParE family toxin n=1 Tax=Hespellia stercorisuis TaxID=180311 RepID=UPI000A04AE8D
MHLFHELLQIKKDLGIKITSNITKKIRRLRENPRKCPSIEAILDISSPYHFLHVEHHCIFYRIDDDKIYISDIYNEREDFMWKMFGIRLRSEERVEFWGE